MPKDLEHDLTTVKGRLRSFIDFLDISDTEFQNSIGAGNGYVNNIRKGLGDKQEKIFSTYPQLNKSWLLFGEGAMVLEQYSNSDHPKIVMPLVNEEEVKLSTAKDLSVRKPKIHPQGPVLIPYLPIKAQAGYVKSYDQVQYMDTLERFALPPGIDHRGAEWMYFEIDGDSMEETFTAGDIILASMVNRMDWDQLRNFYVYVIITHETIMIKRVFRKSEKEWVLISDNEENYPQELLEVEQVKQLWVYRRTWHTNAKPPKEFKIKI